MWAQWVNTFLGLWLYASPMVLGYADPARMHNVILGPIVTSFAFVAVWQITRGLRWVNVLAGAWSLLAPWLLGFEALATVNNLVIGALLLGLSLVKGEEGERYGGGWRSLVQLARNGPPRSDPEDGEERRRLA